MTIDLVQCFLEPLGKLYTCKGDDPPFFVHVYLAQWGCHIFIAKREDNL